MGSNNRQPQLDLDLRSSELSQRNVCMTPRHQPYHALVFRGSRSPAFQLHCGLLSALSVGSTSVSNGLELHHFHEMWGFDLPEADKDSTQGDKTLCKHSSHHANL